MSGDLFGCDNLETAVMLIYSEYRPGLLQTSYNNRVIAHSKELSMSNVNNAQVEKT